ncbi:hypothetical protein ACRHQP_00765 [Burkholderia pseudomallei]|uniref:hypothetical protein n=1 Tax=Burkholderia pseudomallei TaxID=28450 RepID=UPI004063A783
MVERKDIAEVEPIVAQWIRERGTMMDGASYAAALELAAYVVARRTTPDREAIESALREMQGAVSPYSTQRECHVFDMTMALAINILHRALKNAPTTALDRLAENERELGLDYMTAPTVDKGDA